MSTHIPPGFYRDPFGQYRWWDGRQWGRTSVELGYVLPRRAPRQSWAPMLATVFILGLFIAGGTALAVIRGAEHWDKVIDPGHPETFSWKTHPTGVYQVVESGDPVCVEGQDWHECMDALAVEYVANCEGRPLNDFSQGLCASYRNEIDHMRKLEAPPGSTVVSGGDFYHLSVTEEVEEVRESNNDYRPAVTRPCICVFGVFGECPSDSDRREMEKVLNPEPTRQV